MLLYLLDLGPVDTALEEAGARGADPPGSNRRAGTRCTEPGVWVVIITPGEISALDCARWDLASLVVCADPCWRGLCWVVQGMQDATWPSVLVTAVSR